LTLAALRGTVDAMDPDDEFDPRPPRRSVWAAMNDDPQLRDDLRALRRGGAVVLVVLVGLVLLVVLSR
jgi:hypothetical protein